MERYWKAINHVYDHVLFHAKKFPDTKSVHGAVLFYRHKVVSWGLNRPDRTAMDNKCCSYSIHAEVDVYHRSHPRHKKKARELLVFRCARDGSLTSSRCCDKCRNFLNQTGIRRVVYTTKEGGLEVEKL